MRFGHGSLYISAGILAAAILMIATTGCGGSTLKTPTANLHQESARSQPLSPPATGMPVKGNAQTVYDSLEIDNLNSDTNMKVYIDLPNNWHATESIYKLAKTFSFNESKDSDIKQLYSYKIYNEHNVEIGDFEFIGFYSGQPYGAAMPNHSSIIKIAYTGETKLGAGTIYVLNSDLPRQERTDKYSTYDQIYAVIPIRNEILAYKFSLKVPLGGNYEKYVNIMEDMLKTS